jgi:hypothetical protein
MCGDYIRWIELTTGFIGSHTITVYALLQLTTVHYNTCRVFTSCLSSNIAGSVHLQLCNSSLKTAARPEYSLVTGTVHILLTLCTRRSPRQLIVLVISGERTTKKTPLWFPYCWMTSLPERTTKNTLVASIVALLSNGYKQRLHCLLLTYSVHVTICYDMVAESWNNGTNRCSHCWAVVR